MSDKELNAAIRERDLFYRLIVSQLFYDGYQSVAISLTNAANVQQTCPPSDRLFGLVMDALKAEGDLLSLSADVMTAGGGGGGGDFDAERHSPALQTNAFDAYLSSHKDSVDDDESTNAANLIDLDLEGERQSGVLKEASGLYDSNSSKELSHTFASVESDLPLLANDIADMGRMISKSCSLQDPIQDINAVHSDSLSPRSSPDLSLSSYGHMLSDVNGMRSITPNMREKFSENEVSAQQSLINPTQQLLAPNIDLSDLITQINLAQLAYYNNDGTSVASSLTNTPSPTPLTPISSMNPNVPLVENGGLVLNETAIKNLSQLAKFSASEVQNGLSMPLSSSPQSLTPIGRSSSAGSKPNVMQIRCKFGQLGQQKGQFSSPHGFCLGVEEEIVIADTNNHRICIFDKTGDFRHSFGVPGKDEAQLWYPRKVAIIRASAGHGSASSPRYVICDRGAERSRMQIFTRSGHFVRKIAIRYIDIVAGLAITPTGHIVAVDSVSPTVFVIAESGDLLRWFDCSEHMREPSDIAISNREYYICDFKGHCVVVFDDEGHYLRKIGCEGLTSFPNGIDISDAGDILIGDSHGNRFHVVVFDRNGSLISEFECPYVKVSRCCGLKITSEGYVVTLAKNNHHVLVLNTLYIM